jgi:hypothetical protein
MSNKKSTFRFHNDDGEHVTIKDHDSVVKDRGKKSFN